jgi:hypothetical protein
VSKVNLSMNTYEQMMAEAADKLAAEQMRNSALTHSAKELLDAIDKRWGQESARKRENAISPRMEEAIEALRALLT